MVIASVMALLKMQKMAECEAGASHRYHPNPDVDPFENVGSIFR
jgi:hypothetical protein